jgi:CYTH domain-containing protein
VQVDFAPRTWAAFQRFAVEGVSGGMKVSELFLNEVENEHFKSFEGNEIRKNRYFHEFDRRMFEFDVYLGPLWGLNRARVEFQSIEEMSDLILPPWATIEITGNAFFDDANLVNCKFEDVQDELEKAA